MEAENEIDSSKLNVNDLAKATKTRLKLNGKQRLLQVDPLAVTESLGFQTFRKDSRKPWTKQEDKQLSDLMHKLYPNQLHDLDLELVRWDAISRVISPKGFRKSKDCRKRWANLLDPNLRKGKWLKSEDAELVKAYNLYGPSWQKVSTRISGRTDDQCAKRYIEVLDPNKKDRLKPWDREEDLELIRQVKVHGTKWRTISNAFEGRTSLTCRNRWRKIVTQVARGKADTLIKQEVDEVTNGDKGSTLVKQEDDLDENAFANVNSREIMDNSNENNDNLNEDADNLTGMADINNMHNIGHIDSASNLNNNNDLNKLNNFDNMPSINSLGDMNHPSLIEGSLLPNSEVQTTSEWKYQFGNDTLFDELPHKRFLNNEVGGTISNQGLVESLVKYAREHGLEIKIQQHVHHHYASPQDGTLKRSNTNNFNFNNTFDILNFPSAINPITSPNILHTLMQPSFLRHNNHQFMESRTDPRSQHFNYLPPLTEVPRLNSSSPSNSTNSASPGNGMHLHHHHHHHHHHEQHRAQNHQILLNRQIREGDSMENEHRALTPLAQAVEIAAVAEANMKRPQEIAIRPPKKQRTGINVEDSWRTMQKSYKQSMQPISQERNEILKSTLNQSNQQNIKPQPLESLPIINDTSLQYIDQDQQFSRQSNSQGELPEKRNSLEDLEDDVDADMLNSYGLFYNIFTKEGSQIPETQPVDAEQISNGDSAYDQWGGGFGIIPFNPS